MISKFSYFFEIVSEFHIKIFNIEDGLVFQGMGKWDENLVKQLKYLEITCSVVHKGGRAPPYTAF